MVINTNNLLYLKNKYMYVNSHGLLFGIFSYFMIVVRATNSEAIKWQN